MSLTEGELDSCAESFLERVRSERRQARDRGQRLRELAEEAAARLAAGFSVEKVWLFGSLAWGEEHAASDVDLLVEGLAARDWLPAFALVEEVIEVPVDLVRIEEAAPALADRVRREGVILHDRR